jgi:predicted ribosomally synthesized peptide with nif11-like leader
MSQEDARALIARLNDDEQFRARIFAVEKMEERIKTINDEGYSCTIEELQEINQIEGGSDNDISGGEMCWGNFCFN